MTDPTNALNEINRTLGSVVAEIQNLKEDLRDHRTAAEGRSDNVVMRLDNAVMRLSKLEAQIDDIVPEVGTLKKLREQGAGIVGAVGLTGSILGAGGALLATHWPTVTKFLGSLVTALPK